MDLRTKFVTRIVLVAAFSISAFDVNHLHADNSVRADSSRYTPLVRAVENCRMSVVNLRGRKSVPVDPTAEIGPGRKMKQVNGMGTGVVIDSRGYVLTNFHVVEGVKTIEVTTSDRTKTVARLLAHDPQTDLAILKIETDRPLPTIKIGSSSDLMLAEQVTAVGNAYGYEHTVTVGIISALNRTVQVNDDQIYRNLIQTDAAINPGNSGGPLLNMNGEMIGINVAVRIGAQGIAFAIPVNDALEVATELMQSIVPGNVYHGLSLKTIYVDERAQIVVDSVAADSPASEAGLRRGDRLVSIDGNEIDCELDFYSALVDNERRLLDLSVQQEDQFADVRLALVQSPVGHVAMTTPAVEPTASSIGWLPLGLKLAPISAAEMADRHPNYKRGLRVVDVRKGSPAAVEGIMPGDILVAMHGWKTESIENLAYILQRPDVVEQKDFMFYILRDKEPFWGQMRVARLPSH